MGIYGLLGVSHFLHLPPVYGVLNYEMSLSETTPRRGTLDGMLAGLCRNTNDFRGDPLSGLWPGWGLLVFCQTPTCGLSTPSAGSL